MQPFAASSAVLVSLPEGRGYPIYFAGLAEVPARLRQRGHLPGPCFVVTDAHVAEAHLPTLVAALEGDRWQPHVYTLPPGEDTKNMEACGRVQTWALEHGIDRTRPLLALGGGVVGDLAGFAAATLLRGVPLIQLPTSLIAQVDAAIGGKTGINHPLGKNLLGAFYQPSLIVIDQTLLATLPDREYHSGLAEVVKYALIADAAFFDFLEARWDALLARDPEVLAHAVQRSVELKAQIVSVDEREHGRRALLNFGHTFGHAIEKVSGYGTFTHGEAVALGMRAALHLSRALRLDLPFERADALVARLPVPEGLAYLSIETLMAAMGLDKKRVNGQLRFVVLDALGQARVVGPVDPALVASAWAYARVMGG